jgi:hypothetical protein
MTTPHATVTFDGEPRTMKPGSRLTFGRGADRRIRIAHDPADDFVSREAGTIIAEPDRLLIRNDSLTQQLILRPFPGPETVIDPGAAAGTGRHEKLRLIVPGRRPHEYVLHLATGTLRPGAGPGGPGATKPAAYVTPAERRLLAALCEPLLVCAGVHAVPATYREIANRAGRSPDGVRAALDALRRRLTGQDGIPGLRGTDGPDYRLALARWAVNSGTVRLEHLKLL